MFVFVLKVMLLYAVFAGASGWPPLLTPCVFSLLGVAHCSSIIAGRRGGLAGLLQSAAPAPPKCLAAL